jgi:hypothetical protein
MTYLAGLNETFYTMTQEISLKEASELIKSAASSLEKDILAELNMFVDNDRKIICYNGDTALPELKVGEYVVIVNGNLNVTGIISDCDCQDSSLLIVLGNVTCKNLITLSAMFITGDLKVAHTLLADSANDFVCKIGGNLDARTILERGHWIEIKGEATYQFLHHTHGKPRDKNGILKPNLANWDVMEDMKVDPDYYKDYSYVPMIKEVQNQGYLNTEKAISFIENGVEWFNER